MCIMAVCNIITRVLSYGKSGVSSYKSYYGSGRIGVALDRNCQDAH